MDPLLQGEIAVAVIGILVGLGLSGYATATLRQGAHRTSLLVLLASSVGYTAYSISAVVTACIPSPSAANVCSLFGFLTEDLVTVAGFILMWHRAGKKYPRAQRIFEWVVLVPLFFLPVLQVAFGELAISKAGSPDPGSEFFTELDDWNIALTCSFILLSFRGVLVLDYLVSAVRLRKVVKILAKAYLPLLVLLYGWDTATILFVGWNPFTNSLLLQPQLGLLVVFLVIIAAMIGTLVTVARASALRGSPSSSQAPIDLELRSQHADANESEVATQASG